jgi:hypothetical protein
MNVNYTNVVEAMVEARKRGLEPETVVLTERAINEFLLDDKYNDSVEKEEKEHLADGWSLPVQSGDSNHLITEDGTRIQL